MVGFHADLWSLTAQVSSMVLPTCRKVTPFLQPGGAPYYDTYATSDGRYLAIGAIEPQFYKAFVKGAASMCTTGELASAKEALLACKQHDSSSWHALTSAIERIISSATIAQWTSVFAPSGPYADACVTPVLTLPEASVFARDGKVVVDSTLEAIATSPEAAPRLHDVSGPGEYPVPSAKDCIVEPGSHTTEVLTSLGYSGQQVRKLAGNKVVMQAEGAPSLDARM
jgi:alpha-methylacyl-CoA racemase